MAARFRLRTRLLLLLLVNVPLLGASEDAPMALESDACLAPGCHEAFATRLSASRYPHAGVSGKTCTACHARGAGDGHGMTARPLNTVCHGCHKLQAAALRDAKSVHDPVAKGRCLACHNPHGSDHPKMLILRYPTKEYLPYESRAYELCWSCHDRALAEEAKTSRATSFRNGADNLHHLHAHARNGVSCLACHEIHASRDAVLMGGNRHCFERANKMYLKLDRSATGGRCTVSCHKELSYDRQDPVSY